MLFKKLFLIAIALLLLLEFVKNNKSSSSSGNSRRRNKIKFYAFAWVFVCMYCMCNCVCVFVIFDSFSVAASVSQSFYSATHIYALHQHIANWGYIVFVQYFGTTSFGKLKTCLKSANLHDDEWFGNYSIWPTIMVKI